MKSKKLLAGILSATMIVSSFITSVSAVTSDNVSTGYYNQSEKYSTYNGKDLGAIYTKSATTFKVWAPSASKVEVKRYKTGSDNEAGAGVLGTVAMSKNNSNGTWSTTVNGDLNGTYYTYLVTVNGRTQETQDVYSVATGVNGNRSMVIDLSDTDPTGWQEDNHVMTDNATDAVVWEVQIRDFSIHDSSGVDDKYQGKYLAFTQNGTKLNGSGDMPTCVDYLVEQGVNYVHLNPCYDYGSVDETRLNTPQYNWGYDPVNYNVPEGSYSTNPYDGATRIKEFKQMVQALHDRGIGVIIDVVYNHVYSATDSAFEKTVPGYYFRMGSESKFLDGSGCGNVTASEKTMYRKYMIDSVKYWAEEYNIDGFRFDLMGCHDINTMNTIRDELDKIDSRILIYGEPWMADWNGGNGLPNSEVCILDNASRIDNGIGMFSDKIRNALKGGTDDATQGYIQGSQNVTNDVKAGMMGGASNTFGKWSKQPSQAVTYSSAHDNLTLWDKLLKSNNSSDYDGTNQNILQQNKLSAAIVLTSQGMPFYLAGEEFARTKHGDHNSYKSPDSVNQIDWNRTKKYSNLVEYYKGLMKIRANYSPFRDPTTNSINTTYFSQSGSAIGYTIQNKTANASNEWGTVAVLTNNSSNSQTVTLKVGSGASLPSSWVVVANGDKAGVEKLSTMNGSSISVPAKTALVLVDENSFNKVVIPEKNKFNVTVEHIDASNNKILKTTTASYSQGAKYTTQADAELLKDYALTRTVGDTQGTVQEDIVVKYYYTYDSTPRYNLTIKYVDENGKNVSNQETIEVKEGSVYNPAITTIEGYELDTDKLPTNLFEEIRKDTTIVYTYKQTVKQSSKLKVHYYNANSWSKPHIYTYDGSGSSATLLSGKWPGTEMKKDTQSGDGWYVYDDFDVESARVMFTDGASQQEPGASQPGYEASGEVWLKNGEISYGGKVVVSYVNMNGKKLQEDTVLNRTSSGSQNYETQGLEGYSNPIIIGEPTGQWTSQTINVIYVYDVEEEKETITFLLGDVEDNSKIDITDVVYLQHKIIRKIEFDARQELAGDINGDNSISITDILEMQKYLSMQNVLYPIGTEVTVELN